MYSFMHMITKTDFKLIWESLSLLKTWNTEYGEVYKGHNESWINYTFEN